MVGIISFVDNDDTSPGALQTQPPYTIHPTLYRFRLPRWEYIEKEIIQAVENHSIFTSGVPGFYDHREMKPNIIPAPVGAYLQAIDFCFSMHEDWLFPDRNLRRVSQLAETPYLKFRRMLLQNLDGQIENLRERAVDDLEYARSKVRIACLCRNSTSTYMWERYGAVGKGICFVYELDLENGMKSVELLEDHLRLENMVYTKMQGNPVNTDYRRAVVIGYCTHSHFSDVVYSDAVPFVTDLDINGMHVKHPDRFAEAAVRLTMHRFTPQSVFFTKDVSYAGEREWRFVYKRTDEYAPFPAFRLTGIILGASTESSLDERIGGISSKYSLKLYRATPSLYKYGFDIIPL